MPQAAGSNPTIATTGRAAQDAAAFIPGLADIGILNVVAAAAKGLAVQVLRTTAGAGTLTFVDPMANTNYFVFGHNHTDLADQPAVLASNRTVTGFTFTGGAAADEIEFLVIGQLKGQLA